KDDYIAAYEAYAAAFQKDPGNLYYKTSYERLKFNAAAVHTHRGEKLRDQGDMSGALTEFVRALEIDPANELAEQDIRQTKQKLAAAPIAEPAETPESEAPLADVAAPAELKPTSNEPITIHAFQDSKVVYQTVGKIAGINVLFDPDYTAKRVQVDLQNVSLTDALHILGVLTNTFWRPVTANTIFVAQNTRAKRTELDAQAVQTFYLSNVSQTNDLNDVQTALRNVLTNAKLYAVPSQNAIVMRATPDELLLARKLIDDLDKARPEVVVDVDVLEVNKNHERNLGIILPQTFSASLQPSTTTTTGTTTTGTTTTGTTTTGTTTTGTTTGNGLTLNNLGNLNSNNVAVNIGTATANLLLTDSDSRTLQNPRIRAADGQKADLKIGSRIPIATGSYQTGAATAIVSSLVNTQFQYQDVGVEIEITPTIHYNHDVTLKLKINISAEGPSVNLSGIEEPTFTQRVVEQTIRLKEGEASILGGLLQTSLTNSFSGTPGLSNIPLLKYLFSNNDKVTQQDEIVILLVPHVVRGEELSPLNLKEIDTGTGTSVSLRRIGTVRVPASAVEQAPGAGSAEAPPAGQQPAPAAAQPQGLQQAAQQAIEQQAAGSNAAPVSVALAAPPSAPKVGSNFQVAVNVSGGTDVFSVPLQLQYDPTKLTLINVDSGNYLGHDGQTVALVHRDDGAGGVAVSASRPPGVAGVNGSGQLCVLTFQAKAAGDSIVSVTKAAARDSKQQALPVITSGTIVHVQ
ncbi:MAG TPA: cohesin domain-containing protein, partial [Acidobacteriaceae bacterium]|nr:cohesin domain-containing protein [Acidobacteriaceae bacterium]